MADVNDNEIIGSANIKADDIAASGPQVKEIENVTREDFTDRDTNKTTTNTYLNFTDGTKLRMNKTREDELRALFCPGLPLRKPVIVGKTVKLSPVKVNNPKGGPKVNSIQIEAAEEAAF